MNIGLDARPLISDKPSGIGNYLAEILKAFIKDDKEDVFFLFSNKPLSGIYKFPPNFKTVLISGKIGSFWLRYKIPNYLKKYHIDVFWGTQHVLPQKRRGIRYVLTVHDLALIVNPNWGPRFNSFIQNTISKFSMKEANQIISDSQSTRQDLIKFLHINSEKIRVIWISCVSPVVDASYDQTIALKKFDLIEKCFFLFVGTISKRKNYKSQIVCFDEFLTKHPSYSNYKLVLAGSCPKEEQEELHSLISQAKHSKNIVVTGYISNNEKNALLKNCAALLFPSYYEGFGIPLLEGMEYKVPIITGKNSSLQEIGGDVPFYLDDIEKYDSYEKCFLEVLDLPEAEKKKKNYLSEKRLTLFSWDKCARETLRCIKGEKTDE